MTAHRVKRPRHQWHEWHWLARRRGDKYCGRCGRQLINRPKDVVVVITADPKGVTDALGLAQEIAKKINKEKTWNQ